MSVDLETRERARLSEGHSSDAVHSRVVQWLAERGPFERLADVGCGGGALFSRLDGVCTRYLGCDAVRYPEFPAAAGAEFVESDLNRLPLPLAAGSCDAVVAVETIEHLENPRAFVRELARLCRPGGTVLVTTPNQLSLFAKLHLVLRGQFPAFVDAPGLYPTHITPLLEQDLVRIFREAGLERPEVRYTDQGRIPLTARHWPTGLRGRSFSDNLLVAARKPGPAR